MPTLTVLMGCPASGKSTLAKQMVTENPNTIRVNQDDLREMLHTGDWSKQKEQATRAVRYGAIEAALAAGFNVVSDDTNLEPSIRAHLRKIAQEYGDYKEEVVQIDYGQALLRDKNRERTVGEDVIKKFYLRALELGIYRD